jgi:hypothetical protein
MCNLWEEGKMSTGFWRGNLREGKHLASLVVDRRIILKGTFEN